MEDEERLKKLEAGKAKPRRESRLPDKPGKPCEPLRKFMKPTAFPRSGTNAVREP